MRRIPKGVKSLANIDAFCVHDPQRLSRRFRPLFPARALWFLALYLPYRWARFIRSAYKIMECLGRDSRQTAELCRSEFGVRNPAPDLTLRAAERVSNFSNQKMASRVCVGHMRPASRVGCGRCLLNPGADIAPLVANRSSDFDEWGAASAMTQCFECADGKAGAPRDFSGGYVGFCQRASLWPLIRE